jgi:uncharacterized protein YpiB (UPF0302 family)
MTLKNKSELLKQIEAYNLKVKFQELEDKDQSRRPFVHLPKQFAKGILIGNIAIVPRKHHEGRYVYVIADMIEAKILHEEIWVKQSAILIAHHIAESKEVPQRLLKLDSSFASRLFEIKNAKRFYKQAMKSGNEDVAFVYENKLLEANDKADQIKDTIQSIFDSTFRTNHAK